MTATFATRRRLVLIGAAAAALAVASSVACEPPDTVRSARNPDCLYPGDTLGTLSAVDSTGRVVECHYLVETKPVCLGERVVREPVTPCPAGTSNDARGVA